MLDAPADAQATIKALVKRGFLASEAVTDGQSRLQITEAGKAVLEPPADERPKASKASASTEGEADAAAAPKGKVASLVELLRRPDGATVEAMMAATGWQAHSVRGAMSGAIKKTLGLNVTSEKTEAGRIYRIVDGAAA